MWRRHTISEMIIKKIIISKTIINQVDIIQIQLCQKRTGKNIDKTSAKSLLFTKIYFITFKVCFFRNDTLLPMRNSIVIFFLNSFSKTYFISCNYSPSYLLLKENRCHEVHKEEDFDFDFGHIW